MNKVKNVLKAVWNWFLGLGKLGKTAVVVGLLVLLIVITPGGQDEGTSTATPTAATETTEAPEPAEETTEAPEPTQEEPVEETTEQVEEKPGLLERTNEAAEVASEQGLQCLDATLAEEVGGRAASASCAAGDGWLAIIYTQDGDVQDAFFESAKELWNEEAATGSVTWDFYTVDGVDEQFIFMGTAGVLYEVGTAIEQEMNVVVE